MGGGGDLAPVVVAIVPMRAVLPLGTRPASPLIKGVIMAQHVSIIQLPGYLVQPAFSIRGADAVKACPTVADASRQAADSAAPVVSGGAAAVADAGEATGLIIVAVDRFRKRASVGGGLDPECVTCLLSLKKLAVGLSGTA